MDATRSGKKNVPKRARAHTRIAYLLILSLTSFVRIPSVLRKKRPRRVVPSRRFERVQFFRRPSIHVCAFHRRDVHSERSVHPGAIETHEHAKRLRRPLRVGRVAIEAQLVPFLAEERVEQRVALVLRRHSSSSSSLSSSSSRTCLVLFFRCRLCVRMHVCVYYVRHRLERGLDCVRSKKKVFMVYGLWFRVLFTIPTFPARRRMPTIVKSPTTEDANTSAASSLVHKKSTRTQQNATFLDLPPIWK